MTVYKPLTIVNERDEVIGQSDFATAQEQGLLRRSADVYLFRADGKMLLQTRGPHISWPGLLDKAAGGYVDFGDGYEDTAYRELQEELGIVGIPLRLLGAPVRQGFIFTALFAGILPADAVLSPDPEEVVDISWWSIEDLSAQMNQAPHLFIPNFVSRMHEYGDLIWSAYEQLVTVRH